MSVTVWSVLTSSSPVPTVTDNPDMDKPNLSLIIPLVIVPVAAAIFVLTLVVVLVRQRTFNSRKDCPSFHPDEQLSTVCQSASPSSSSSESGSEVRKVLLKVNRTITCQEFGGGTQLEPELHWELPPINDRTSTISEVDSLPSVVLESDVQPV